MKKHTLLLFVFMLPLFAPAQTTSIIKWNTLHELLNKKNDTTYVINFWATWCKGCVAELPYFIEQEQQLKDKPVKFYYISLDFKKDFNTRLLPFVEKQQMKGEVLLLDEPDYNSWIDKVDTRWGGAIPATVVYNYRAGKRDIYEQEFEKEELKQTLKKYIP